MPVKGIAQVKKAYSEKVKEISGPRTHAAIHTILSQGGSMAATMTPIDMSLLINSQTAPEIKLGATHSTGRIGYTADYAGAVHDSPGKTRGLNVPRDPNDPSRGSFWDPNAEPKFLEKGFEEVKKSIPRILKAVYGA